MTKKNKATKKKQKPSTSGKTANRTRLDPDRLAALEDERDTLLLSLADLEREYEAGDLDETDYQTLHDGYTARTAAVLRAIEGHQQDLANSKTRLSPQRRLAATAMVAGFAVIVGIFLARTLGERGVDDALSGSIDTSRRDQVIDCRRQGENGNLVASLECYDDVIEVDPTNAEALTYRGWFRILQVDTLTEVGQAEAAQQLLSSGQRDLNLAIEIDPTGPDAYAFRSVVHSRLGRSEAACDDIASLIELDPPQFYLTQTERIAETNSCQTS